jgi:hypothetical protein
MSFTGRSLSGSEVSTRDVMKFKLHYAQGVLEGIAMENYPLIRTNAMKLSRLSQSADWRIRQTPEYQRFTTEFRHQADALAKAAADRNVDAATVAYFQLTVSCVNCHRYLRGAGRAGLTPGVVDLSLDVALR